MTTHALDQAFAGTPPAAASTRRVRAGRVLSGIAVLFLLFDGVTKLMGIEPVRVAMDQLGWAHELSPTVGVLLLACLALYLVPRTSVLGAVLLTAFLGGAVASQVRVGNPLASHALFPVYVAFLVWGGLYLRDSRLRAFNPLWRNR